MRKKLELILITMWLIAGIAVPADAISLYQGPRLFDRFGDVPLKEERIRLDNFAYELRRQSGRTKGYIVVYSNRAGEARKRADRARAYLQDSRGIGTDQLVSIDHCVRAKLEFELYLVPEGARFDPCGRTKLRVREYAATDLLVSVIDNIGGAERG